MLTTAMSSPSVVRGMQPPEFRVITQPDVRYIPQLARLPQAMLDAMKVVAGVLPFRVNSYVLDTLIDWERLEQDPIFRIVFPVAGMLEHGDYTAMATSLENDSPERQRIVASEIRARLNPHPADQLSLNRPMFEDEYSEGLQHKYRNTVLFFPADAQTCHSYCTFCFRWAQFVREPDLRIAMSDRDLLIRYLRAHEEVTDLLITGGDAFSAKARRLRFFLEPLMGADLRHVTSIRFGTKALSFWPYRFLTDPDATELLDLIRSLSDAGKQVAIMVHLNHWRELTPVAEEAIARLQGAGAILRTQSPILAGINDDAETWSRLWKRQVELKMVPYYMFLARDTGPKDWFQVPLARAWDIYTNALQPLSGLARTVRGPSMSTSPGKVEVVGVAEVAGTPVFVLRFLQARASELCHRPFFAKYDPAASWFSDLRPAFESDRPFFEHACGAAP